MDIYQLLKFLEFSSWLDYLIAIYLGSFAIQLFYYLFIFSRLAFFKSKQNNIEEVPVSVIICAKNERDNLLNFLPAYLKQDYPKFEIIVVNDSSVDDTRDVLRAFALQYKTLKIVNVPDNKRMKLKFWNRNYVLFKSFGTEIRFQKEVSFLGISGWQKSYPDKIALGINHLQYNFERGVGNHLNNSFFHQKIYTYKGYHYFSDGTTSYTPPPNVAFPLAETLGLNEGLKLTRIFPYTDFSFKINITQHENANLINKAGSALLDFGVKKIPSIFSIPTENPSLFKIDFFKNAVSVEVDNKNWRAETENNITKYLDVSVPSISITADIGANGESFFSNPNLNFPNLDFETYKTSSVDFYGAVLYENVWYE